MSDRPTPETDKYADADWWTVFRATEHARILERERDEAREALEAVNALEEMHAKPGSMEIAIKQNPAQAQWVAKCFASMVAASPNYTEMKFDLVAEGEKWEWLTVLIQKGNGKTPHQLRQEAEKERDEAREKYDNLATEHMLVVNKLCEERNEAQNASEAFSALAWKLEGERNEAREKVARLQEIISQCLDCSGILSTAKEGAK